MEKEYWLNKWQTNDTPWHSQEINRNLIDNIDKLELQPGNCILVPLCGKTKDMLWLADRGYHVIGIELCPMACTDFFKELNIEPRIANEDSFQKYQHKNIEIYCVDVFKLTEGSLPTIHAVYDNRALIALPPSMQKKYVDHLVACIGTHVKYMLLTIESSCVVTGPPFSINRADVDSLFAEYCKIEQLNRIPCTKIPEHLIKKGYAELVESTYYISPDL